MSPSEQIRAFLSGKSAPPHQEIEAPAANSKSAPASEPEPLSEAELAEAHRIARELVKLHAAGAIGGPNDPEARFYANLLHTFQGEFAGRRAPAEPPEPS
jgi:hypothetical protein